MTTSSTKNQIIGLIIWLVICFIASAIGGIASIQAKEFYILLIQPQWAPPSWVFGPVWTTLYTLMGISAWLVWRRGGFQTNLVALSFFLAQLMVNALWSWLFFAWKLGLWSFIDILLLLALIIATIISFWRIHRFAAMLLVPYLLWVSFALMLNYSLWQLNPKLLG